MIAGGFERKQLAIALILGFSCVVMGYGAVRFLTAFPNGFRSVMFYLGWTGFAACYVILAGRDKDTVQFIKLFFSISNFAGMGFSKDTLFPQRIVLDDTDIKAGGYFCSFCGKRLSQDAMFCEHCGKKITRTGEEQDLNTGCLEESPEDKAEILRDEDIQSDIRKEDSKFEQIINVHDENTAGKVDKTGNLAGGFLNLNDLIIDEKISAFKFANSYKVYDMDGNPVGAIEQTGISGGAKAARMLLGGNVKGVQGFTYNLRSLDGSILATLSRGGLGSGVNALRTISIADGNRNRIASLRIVPNLWTPEMEVLDMAGNLLCKISGDWKGYNFTMKDASGDSIGTINKKWTGIARELFTSADKYHVSLNMPVSGRDRTAVCAAAVAVDMILHEN